MKVVVVCSVLALQLNGGVPRDVGDRSVDDSDSVPCVISERRRADVLSLVAGTGRA